MNYRWPPVGSQEWFDSAPAAYKTITGREDSVMTILGLILLLVLVWAANSVLAIPYWLRMLINVVAGIAILVAILSLLGVDLGTRIAH